MSTCSTYWKALNEADEKLAALQSMLAKAAAPAEEIRKSYDSARGAQEEYVRLCKEGIELADGRRVWGPDLLALNKLAQENGITIEDWGRHIVAVNENGRVVSLRFDMMNLTTLASLRGLRLERFVVSFDKGITDLAGLKGMKTLKSVTAFFCGLTSLEELRGLELEELSVPGNEVTSFAGIEGMTTLRNLIAHSCRLGTLEELRGLRIEKLTVTQNVGLKALTGLEGMSTLRELAVLDCDLRTLESLKGLAIETLNVSNNPNLTSLAGIEGMHTLRRVIFGSCSIPASEVVRLKETLPFIEFR